MSFLDDLPGILADALGPEFRDAVYEIDGPGTGAPHDPTAGAPQSYPCKAINDQWGAYYKNGGLVSGDERKILILAHTLAVEPQEGGRITIQGQTFQIVSEGGSQPAVTSDPAGATWECRGRS